MKDDKAKHNILPPSKFGVIEITRQRVREVTDIKTSEKCPSCDGKGVVEAPLLFTDNLESKIRFIAEEGKNGSVTMLVHPMVEAYLTKGWFNSTIKKWKKKYKMNIKLEADSSLEFLENHIYDVSGNEVVI